MASMGLAWYQGQKNAQDAARGQIATMLDMAKNAAEADRQMEYFSPIEKESRSRASDIKKAKLDALKDIDKISKEFYSNPKEAAKKLLKEQYGGDFDIIETPEGIKAVESVSNGETGGQAVRTLDLGMTNEQMLDRLIKEKYFSSEEKAANVIGRSDAQIASGIKQQEMDAKNRSFARWINDPDNITELQKSKVAAGASMYGANIGARSAIEQANIGMGLRGMDVTKFAADTAARELGMTWDDVAKDYVGTVIVDGKQVQMPLKDMPGEAKTKFASVYKGALAGFSNPVDNSGRQVNPLSAAQAAAQATRRALEQAGISPAPGTPAGVPATPVDPYAQWRTPSAQQQAPGDFSFDPAANNPPATGLPARVPPNYNNSTPRY